MRSVSSSEGNESPQRTNQNFTSSPGGGGGGGKVGTPPGMPGMPGGCGGGGWCMYGCMVPSMTSGSRPWS